MQSEFIRSNCHDAPVVKTSVSVFSREEVVLCAECREVMGAIILDAGFELDMARFRYTWLMSGPWFPLSNKLSDFVRRINGV